MLLDLIESSHWRQAIEQRVEPDAIADLQAFLEAEAADGKTIYPPRDQWFRALNLLESEQVRVVILGQDPYHGPGQAQGLSFSVPEGMKLPPSLRNIFKELNTDLSVENKSGDLTSWAKQGVLLLNAVLTVAAGQANSHAGQGWEAISDAVIDHLNDEYSGIVFMLWGGYAQKKAARIDANRHCVLLAPHPSPLSAHRGWFGCGHFSAANSYLSKNGSGEIDWRNGSSEQFTLL